MSHLSVQTLYKMSWDIFWYCNIQLPIFRSQRDMYAHGFILYCDIANTQWSTNLTYDNSIMKMLWQSNKSRKPDLCSSLSSLKWKESQASLEHPIPVFCFEFSFFCAILFPEWNFQIIECIQENNLDFNIDKPRLGKIACGIY